MKRLILSALLAIAASALAVAQEAASPVAFRLFGLESSVVAGYDVGTSAVVGGYGFGLNFLAADKVVAGVQTVNLTSASFAVFKLSYYLNDLLGMSLYLGSDLTTASAASGVGAFVNLMKDVPENGFATGYMLKLDYLFPTTDLTAGAIALSAALSLGL